MLIVVAIIVIIVSLFSWTYRKLRYEAWLTAQHAQMKQIIDNAVIRGAIKTPQQYEDAMNHLTWQIEQARRQKLK